MSAMILLRHDGMMFHYRVAGVALHEGHVLLQQSVNGPIWALPGGHAEVGETTAQTLVREMQEELGASVRVGRLLWVVESLFPREAIQHHELGLIFLMDLGAACEWLYPGPLIANEDGLPMTVAWHPLSNLEALPLHPVFLRRGLQSVPENVTHMITS